MQWTQWAARNTCREKGLKIIRQEGVSKEQGFHLEYIDSDYLLYWPILRGIEDYTYFHWTIDYPYKTTIHEE